MDSITSVDYQIGDDVYSNCFIIRDDSIPEAIRELVYVKDFGVVKIVISDSLEYQLIR